MGGGGGDEHPCPKLNIVISQLTASTHVVGWERCLCSKGLYPPASASLLVMSTRGRVEPLVIVTGTWFDEHLYLRSVNHTQKY